MPSPRCSAVASLLESNSHLQGWKIQSLVLTHWPLLGLCSFAISLHIECFVSWARRVLHELSSRSLRRQRITGTYNWSSDNPARFRLLTSHGNSIFPGFPERHRSPTVQWGSNHASVLLHFLSSLFHNKMSMPLPSVLLLFETHLIKKVFIHSHCNFR